MKRKHIILIFGLFLLIIPIFLQLGTLLSSTFWLIGTVCILGILFIEKRKPKKQIKQNYLYYSPEEHSYLYE